MKSQILFYDRSMIIPTNRGHVTHFYGELMYIIFDKPYCVLHFAENVIYSVEIAIQHVMDNLPKAPFIKCERSAIVNLCYHKAFIRNTREIVMVNSERIKVSKQNVNDINSAIKNIPIISPPCPNCYTCRNDECERHIVLSQKKDE